MDNFPPKKKKEDEKPPEPVNKWRIDEWFPKISPTSRKNFKTLHSELLKLNKELGIVSPKTIPQSDAIHFADSILGSQIIYNSCKLSEIYDFCSGSGFPGLVMASLYPDVKVIHVEQDARKSDYIKHCIKLLCLQNSSCLNQSPDAFPAGKVQYGMSRGFTTISRSILATRKVFVKGGTYFHLKGEEWATELADIPTQLCTFWQPGLVGEYKLPIGEVKFAVVKTFKISD